MLFGILFFERPLNHLSQKGNSKLLMELTFKRKILIAHEDFKGLSPSTPPWKEKVLSAGLTILKAFFLSI